MPSGDFLSDIPRWHFTCPSPLFRSRDLPEFSAAPYTASKKIVTSYLNTLRSEVRPTVRLALPLVLAELGWMSMAIVDTMMVGRLRDSAVAMGAVSLGSGICMVLALFGE